MIKVSIQTLLMIIIIQLVDEISNLSLPGFNIDGMRVNNLQTEIYKAIQTKKIYKAITKNNMSDLQKEIPG